MAPKYVSNVNLVVNLAIDIWLVDFDLNMSTLIRVWYCVAQKEVAESCKHGAVIENGLATLGPPDCVPTNECGIVDKIWRRGPMSFEHVSLWYLLFDPHLTMHQSNIGVQLRKVTK